MITVVVDRGSDVAGAATVVDGVAFANDVVEVDDAGTECCVVGIEVVDAGTVDTGEVTVGADVEVVAG